MEDFYLLKNDSKADVKAKKLDSMFVFSNAYDKANTNFTGSIKIIKTIAVTKHD